MDVCRERRCLRLGSFLPALSPVVGSIEQEQPICLGQCGLGHLLALGGFLKAFEGGFHRALPSLYERERGTFLVETDAAVSQPPTLKGFPAGDERVLLLLSEPNNGPVDGTVARGGAPGDSII